MVVDGVDEVVVVMVVDEERGSSSSRSLEELSSLNVDRLLLANTKCLMARMTAVALYACCKIFFSKNHTINNTNFNNISFVDDSHDSLSLGD